MRHSQFISQLEQSLIDFGIDPSIAVTHARGDKCAANNFLALAIDYTSPRHGRNQVIEVKFADRPRNGNIAFLLTCKDTQYQYSQASIYHVAAVLADAEVSDTSLVKSGAYSYRSDYFVIHAMALSNYERRYQSGSHIWGGLYHRGSTPFASVVAGQSTISAVPNLKLPTKMHERAAARANSDPNSIGRFLSLYHLIELSFDLDLINDIKALPDDMKKVGKLLANFDEKELPRLVRLIKKYWPDVTSLLATLKLIFDLKPSFATQLEEMLFDYGKDGFPWGLKDSEPRKRKFLTTIRGVCTLEQLGKDGCEPTVENLQKAVAFVIYRFRCAIAHASIGEYILTLEDEDFVEKVGEPLVRSLVYRMYC